MNVPLTSRIELWRGHLRRIRSWVRRAIPFASGVLAALVALFFYSLLTPQPHQLTQSEVNDTVVQALASATPRPAYSAQVYAVIQPSLVFIQTGVTPEKGQIADGAGSGVIINDNGDILTSLHVVADAPAIQVIFADGTESSAQIAGAQPENDIAVLQASQLPAEIVPATLGNPNAMHVGDEAYVVGNPFGLYSSMSAGIISGFNRTFHVTSTDQVFEGLIQVDAAVNPGNSGGPLLNREGQVVGIVVALYNPTVQDVFVGVGFAVPITTAGRAAGSPPV